MLGLPGESGGADVDKLYDLRGSFGQLALEQVTCGIDVQDDRLVYVILGFDAANAHVQVVHFGVVLGDPRDDHCVDTISPPSSTRTARRCPCRSCPSDAGYLTATVKTQCARRRWWIPTVGSRRHGPERSPDQ